MAGAWAVAMAAPAPPSPSSSTISAAAPWRMSFLPPRRHRHHHHHRAARSGSGGRARFSRGPVEAEPGKVRAPQPQEDDSSYLWKLGVGSIGGAAAIKYGSVLLPDLTRPNIVQALLMVSLPVAAAVVIMLRASSAEN